MLGRTTLAGLGGIALLSAAGASLAAEAGEGWLDPSDPIETLEIKRKIACSTIDGEVSYYSWSGQAFSRRMGEKDTHLFDVEGMSARTCYKAEDTKRGGGYRLISREILLYIDKDTGEILSQWLNPWSGETVEVYHVENDPVNFDHYENDRQGLPVIWNGIVNGSMWRVRRNVPLFYRNPLAGAFQDEVGGKYHATEMFNFFGPADELLSKHTTKSHAMVGWVRLSDWLPWMKMRGREGAIFFHTSGSRVGSVEEMSERMQKYIAQKAPIYRVPPPAGDERPNMTSWSGYMKARKEIAETGVGQEH